ncbi:MAG: hypothetical protein KDB18_08615, partial [Salinibacterium sp.]|nr:hypothetical protein [Salinibacterium sp.]
MENSETHIGQWRAAILRGSAVTEADADELEGHLREQIADLEKAGLTGEEAFLISVRRLGEVDRLTAEFARAHSDRLWKQLALTQAQPREHGSLFIMLAFALASAVLVQVLRLLAAGTVIGYPTFSLNVSFLIFPVLAAYFLVIRRMR